MTTKTARTHVVIPKELLDAIDLAVGPRKRSQFLAEAAERELRRRRRSELAEQVMGSLADVDIPGWETSESASAWVRDLRRRSDRYHTDGNQVQRQP